MMKRGTANLEGYSYPSRLQQIFITSTLKSDKRRHSCLPIHLPCNYLYTEDIVDFQTPLLDFKINTFLASSKNEFPEI